MTSGINNRRGGGDQLRGKMLCLPCTTTWWGTRTIDIIISSHGQDKSSLPIAVFLLILKNNHNLRRRYIMGASWKAFFTLLTDRSSTIPSNIRGCYCCQSGTWSVGWTGKDQMSIYTQCVCVCVFIKLHITAQSGLVILVIICHSR